MNPHALFAAVCRWDLSAPGFALLDYGPRCTEAQLAAELASLQEALSAQLQLRTGQVLTRCSSDRFDQQTSGPLHRDGGPDESVLMLGYLPTAIESTLQVCDLARCAAAHGQSPAALLETCNPMLGTGMARLAPYIWPVEGMCSAHGQIVLINNSITAPGGGMLGMLHGVTVQPADGERIVLSMQLAPGTPGRALG